jgi:site-specific recombinase XerD
MLAPTALESQIPTDWARDLLVRYAAFLQFYAYAPLVRQRLVREAIRLCRRIGNELATVAAITGPWIATAEQSLPPASRGGPSFRRFLIEQQILSEPTTEERQRAAIMTAVSRVPASFRSATRQYTMFRLHIRSEQQQQRLARVLSLSTVLDDVRMLARFARYLEPTADAASGWALVSEQAVVRYLRSLEVHSNSRNIVRGDLRNFFAYCLRHHLVAHNPVPAQGPREASSSFQPLTPDAQRMLLERWTRLVDPLESLVGCLALFHALDTGALRRLQLADVGAQGARLSVTGRPIRLMLDALTRRALQAYLTVRLADPMVRQNPHLLVSQGGRHTRRPVSSAFLTTRMKKRVGVTVKQLRMTALSTIAQESGPRVLVDAFGLSPTQAGRYQRFLAYRADQALVALADEP